MNRELYQNLLVFLRLFQNRPNHLTSFLIENNAFNNDFLEKISTNKKLSNMAKKGIGDDYLHFNTVSEMKSYYKSLVDDLENLKNTKTKKELERELNEKLISAIENENYEEASRIRDYMRINNINKN